MKRSKEAQGSAQASTAAAAAVLIYQRKQGGKSQNRNQQRNMITNLQLAHSTYQTNKSNVNDNNPQNSDLLLPLFPNSAQPMSGYGTQLGMPGQSDPANEADSQQYSQMSKVNQTVTQLDAHSHSLSQQQYFAQSGYSLGGQHPVAIAPLQKVTHKPRPTTSGAYTTKQHSLAQSRQTQGRDYNVKKSVLFNK